VGDCGGGTGCFVDCVFFSVGVKCLSFKEKKGVYHDGRE